MTSTRRVRGWARVVPVIAALVAICTTASPLAQAPGSRLQHLQGIDELKSWFNAGQGHPRLIFLLSPT